MASPSSAANHCSERTAPRGIVAVQNSPISQTWSRGRKSRPSRLTRARAATDMVTFRPYTIRPQVGMPRQPASGQRPINGVLCPSNADGIIAGSGVRHARHLSPEDREIPSPHCPTGRDARAMGSFPADLPRPNAGTSSSRSNRARSALQRGFRFPAACSPRSFTLCACVVRWRRAF